MKSPRFLVTLLVLLAGVLPVSARPVAAEALPELSLITHTFNVRTATQLRFIFSDDPRFVNNPVEIELHRRVASRTSFQSIATGEARPGVIDALTLLPAQVRRINNSAQFSVPISARTDSPQGLFLAQDGVYPITLRIRDSESKEAIAEILTFINVRRTIDPSQTVQASTLIRLRAAPSLQPNGETSITDEARTKVRQFIEILKNQSYPMTVSVQPEIIEAFGSSTSDSDQALFLSLREQLRLRSITTAPFVPSDPSMFAAMNMRQEFIEQLRVGEDVLNKWLPGVVIHRGTYVADHYLTADGLQLLRTAGIVSVILAPRAQQNISVAGTTNVVMRPSGVNSNNVSVIAVDEAAAQTLVRDSTKNSGELSAFHTAAELLVARDDLLAAGQPAASLRILLSSQSGDPSANSSLVTATSLLQGSTGIRFTDMAAAQTPDRETSRVRFSANTPNTGAGRSAGIAVARKELTSTASMADPADIRRELWSHLFALAVSNTVVNGDDYVAGLRELLGDVRGSVTVTTPDTITLSGRSGAIRIQIRNNSEVPLTVRVRMASAKLRLQDPIRMVKLAAGGTTEVEVEAGTRSNGRFPISIRVTTPEGNLEVVPYIQVTARMNAIAGFGQYVSLFLLLLVLLWWWTHWRRARIQKARGTTVSD
ncbi:unannotated protein [freshwater metagenome]|uniref:Unannotated protein n=1 Tax=freshwater metagenome TaxID=449393 RepID=A0A6J6L2X4_9ZZZZ|nr:hypothetical protein [Actinomycetota bacterium]